MPLKVFDNLPATVMALPTNGFGVLNHDGIHKTFETCKLAEVTSLLDTIENLCKTQGFRAIVLISYEAAAAFDPAFPTSKDTPNFPLVYALVFKDFNQILPCLPLPNLPSSLPSSLPSNWQPSEGYAAYADKIATIKTEIANGNCYQINYTVPFTAPYLGHGFDLFCHMTQQQPTPYTAYIDIGSFQVCSASPELFFEKIGSTLTCKPMKGTTARGKTAAEDGAIGKTLQSDPKTLAENLMITDMIRSDLGRIADTGSVHVPTLFQTEQYPTLWQMTSTVTATVTAPEKASLAVILGALFPCASITGAPKVQAIKTIAKLEGYSRGLYTGAIGLVQPNGDMRFSVAIRTAVVDIVSQQAIFGSGGGIVWDSNPESEYNEMLLKTQFLRRKNL